MEIRQVTSQASETLEEFYRHSLELSHEARHDGGGRMQQCMLDLLRELHAEGPSPLVWGSTSILRLGLHAIDDWKSPTLAFISPSVGGGWYVSCTLPPELQPWPDAEVTGYTEDLAEAIRRVKLGCQWGGLEFR